MTQKAIIYLYNWLVNILEVINMKKLVAYYSRTGNTRKIANEIAKMLGADCEEIIDKNKRKGFIGYFIAAIDALRKKPAKILKSKYSLNDYGIVILGSPTWAGTMAPAMRTYIENNRAKIKKAAFFCTQGGKHLQGIFQAMQDALLKKPAAVLMLAEKEIKTGSYKEKLTGFIKSIK